VPRPVIAARDARRLLLGAQGLLDDPGRRAGPAALQSLIERMGFVQVDSINVVERAHHLTLHSRLDGYRPAMLAALLERERTLFEHWTHDASAIPTRWFAQWRRRFDRYRGTDPRHAWWRARMGPDGRKVIASVLRRVREEGPLLSKDFGKPAGPGPAAADKWWQWKPAKTALEYLWRCGELAVAKRVNFHKVYDLMERVLPRACASAPPDAEEHLHWACNGALDRLGVAAPSELASFWRAVGPGEARRWSAAAARRGEISRGVRGSGRRLAAGRVRARRLGAAAETPAGDAGALAAAVALRLAAMVGAARVRERP